MDAKALENHLRERAIIRFPGDIERQEAYVFGVLAAIRRRKNAHYKKGRKSCKTSSTASSQHWKCTSQGAEVLLLPLREKGNV